MKDFIKTAVDVILAIISVIFVIYAYIAVIVVTAQLLGEYIKIQGVGIISFIVVNLLIAIAVKQFKK